MRLPERALVDDPVFDELYGRGLKGSRAWRQRRASVTDRAFDFTNWLGGSAGWHEGSPLRPIEPEWPRAVLDARDARLSDLPDPATVEALITRNIELDVPAPALRMLCVDTFMRGLTGDLRHLPALEELHDAQFRHDWSGLPTTIHSLAISAGTAHTLPVLPRIERLWLKMGVLAGDVLTAKVPANALRSLRWAPTSGTARALREQEALEYLSLDTTATSVARLSLLGSKPALESASLYGSGLRDLNGIDKWGSLRELMIYRHGGASLAPLAGSPVEILRVYAAGRLSDGWDALGELANLRGLRLDVTHDFDDLSFLRAAERLEVLVLEDTPLGDRALDALVDLPNLRIVTAGQISRRAFDRLEAARPDVLVAGGLTDEQLARRGRVEILDLGTEGFSIFTDLSRSLGVGSNHDAERVVARALPRELRTELDFDSEAGNFCVNAPTREPLEAVLAVIERLITERAAQAA